MIDLLTQEELKLPDIAALVQNIIHSRLEPLPGRRRQVKLYTKNISDIAGLQIPLILEASVGGPQDIYYRLRLDIGAHGYVLGSSHPGRNSAFTKSLQLPFLVETLRCVHTIEDFFDVYHFFYDPEQLRIQ